MHTCSHFPQPTENGSKHFLIDQLRIVNFCRQMKLSLLALFIAFLPLALSLQVGFYSKSCPKAESIVLDVVKQRFIATKGAAGPALIRMYFHDCFVRVRYSCTICIVMMTLLFRLPYCCPKLLVDLYKSRILYSTFR